MQKRGRAPHSSVVRCGTVAELAGSELKTGAFFAALIAVVFAVAPAGMANAQSASCNQLNATLQTLSNNKDFRVLQANQDRARTLANQIRDAESNFVRGGCQAALNQGQKLSGSCMQVARAIVSGRDTYNKLAASIETGQAVSQQREVALQQIARFGCTVGSSAATANDNQSQSPFSRLFEQLFGGNQRVIDDFGYNPNGQTLRTVCVRTCDGYYWPISFSTVPEFLGDDAAACSSQCPGSEVELYYYHNPGETPENMINLDGAPYTTLPNAFRYREEYDASCSCKAPVNYGTIQVAGADSASPGRATVAFSDLDFPLPLRDPRRQTEVVAVAAIHVPLPRPRPARAGEEGDPLAGATPVAAAQGSDLRLLRFGDRVVRLVGPMTPYARSTAKGS